MDLRAAQSQGKEPVQVCAEGGLCARIGRWRLGACVLIAAACAWVGACNLNPQPIPPGGEPGDGGINAGGGLRDGGGGSGGDPRVDAASPVGDSGSPRDAGEDDAGDGDGGAAGDGGNTEDAGEDAGDAGEDAADGDGG